MKIASILAGVAIAALSASAASAQVATYVNPANPGDLNVSPTGSATFTLTAKVSPACLLGGFDTARTLDFGTLGIFGDASDGIDKAFTLRGAANGHIRTSEAGCNTQNKVTITKTGGANGMTASAAAGYDQTVFQANLPYKVAALYNALAVGVVGTPTQAGRSASLDANVGGTGEQTNGAWRSTLAIRVDIPVPAKALIAGTYSDTVTVNLAVI